MPDKRLQKRKLIVPPGPGLPSGSKRRGSQGSITDAPSDHTRGERKKAALRESPAPIEVGGE
jgi:hypothetical protein